MTKNKLYLFLFIACTMGYGWMAFTYRSSETGLQVRFHTCLIKQVTGIPCPSCGSTRSISAALHGHLGEAIWWNPLGLLSLLLILIIPWWILTDWLRKRDSFHRAFKATEFFIRRKYIAILLIILILINWIWNIHKGL